MNKTIFNPERREIKELQQRIAVLEASMQKENKDIVPEVKTEQVKQEIRDYIKEVKQTPSFAGHVKARDEANEVKKMPLTQQVGSLVSLALSDGLQKAIDVAKGLNNPAILDEFHDTLVDNYFDQLVQIGAIKLN